MNSFTEPKQGASEYLSNVEMLLQIPLFARIPFEAIKVLGFLCKRQTYKPNELIFEQHERDPNAYFIIEGQARLVYENGREELLTEYGEGSFLGSLSLVSDIKRLFSLRAASKVTCLTLSREKFQKTLEQFPDIAGQIFENAVMNIYRWEARLLGGHGLDCPQCRASFGVTLV
jgi:CRP/FNR family transcriptional regulator, cyclic AMP receptor protein